MDESGARCTRARAARARESTAVISAYSTLEHEIDDDGVLSVWMNNPPVNAMTALMFHELAACFSEISDAGTEIGAVVLAGRGRHFSAGADLTELASAVSNNPPSRQKSIREAYWAVYDCPVPVVAAVQGAALGSGAAVAAVCDFIIAAQGARIGLPEITVGMTGGAAQLSRILPQQVVRWMLLTGEPVPVEKLIAHGGVLDVVPPEEVMEQAKASCRLIVRHSRVAVTFAKSGLKAVARLDVKDGYEFEQLLSTQLSNHPDATEALTAHIERRPPVFETR